jgi:hypothetical protein
MDDKSQGEQKQPKQYEGAVYIGVVGSEAENGECRDSIAQLARRTGDVGPQFIRGTKGYEVRQMHFNNWLEKTDCAFMFLMDADQIFPPDALERMRSRQMPYLSGMYLRRQFAPVAPVWLTLNADRNFPLIPALEIPADTGLTEIAASGWGCILIHRDVVTAVRALLKGEPEVIEDDMDLWPYDLNKIMAALEVLKTLSKRQDVAAAAMAEYVEILSQEIKPLRGAKDVVGSDIRFPFYARLAGFPLFLDTSVRCKHMLNYPLGIEDFEHMNKDVKANLESQVDRITNIETRKLKQAESVFNLLRIEGRP